MNTAHYKIGAASSQSSTLDPAAFALRKRQHTEGLGFIAYQGNKFRRISTSCSTVSREGFPMEDGFFDLTADATNFGHPHQVTYESGDIGAILSAFNNTPESRLPDNDPHRTSEIQTLLENIRPDVEIPKENREGTPDGLKYTLYEHQKLALAWLKKMEEGTNRGGILADDMGLGKTISALALILSRPPEDSRRKTTLIVGPLALLRQWEEEIETKIDESHRLSTFLYHRKKATWETLRSFDICLTTYGTLAAEFKRLQECDENPNLHRNVMRTRFPLLGYDSDWYRVILDEAQCIKNITTKAAQGACHLKSLTRFCMTGTPMMNGVQELHSLVQFLRIKPYNEYGKFKSDFGCLSRSGGAKEDRDDVDDTARAAMKKLQAVLKAILLRRTKSSTIDGGQILTLPTKTEDVVYALFSENERAYYTSLETKTSLQFNSYVKAGTIGMNSSNILTLLLRLRQAACHPHLIMDFEEVPAVATSKDMVAWAKSLLPNVIRRIIDETVPFECPICYILVVNPRILIPCGHNICSKCLDQMLSNIQQEATAEGNECVVCHGGIDLRKVIDYNTFKQVHMQEAGKAAVDDRDSIGDSPNTSNSETDSYMFSDEESIEDNEVEGVEAKEVDIKHNSLAMLKRETVQGRRRYLQENWVSSAKVDKCLEILGNTEADIKTIIFSQFTTLLDLVEVPIRKNKWSFMRYDGSMSADARHHAVVKFTNDPKCKVMLVSLKAGNAGLNLVAASQVVILDPFWNPFIEMQAVHRAYRIGQQKPVKVYRILIERTVEDRIITMQSRKRELVEAALDEKAGQGLCRLSKQELIYLFNGDTSEPQ